MMRYLPSANETRGMSTDELRAGFLIEDLFQPGQLTLHALDLDRAIVGSAVPTKSAIDLGAPEEIAAAYFTERREIGVLNIGGAGSVVVDKETFELESRDC